MEMLYAWILGKIGLPGIIAVLAVEIIQYVSSAQRAALKDAAWGLIDAFKNIPRRLMSEIERVRQQIRALQVAGLDDEAAVKAAALPLKASVRVIAGLVEDIANRAIDLAVLLVPFLVHLVRVWQTRRPAPKRAPIGNV
jgi:hypothetical protein